MQNRFVSWLAALQAEADWRRAFLVTDKQPVSSALSERSSGHFQMQDDRHNHVSKSSHAVQLMRMLACRMIRPYSSYCFRGVSEIRATHTN